MNFRLGYTPISQFSGENPLDPLVVSDHAEIILETPYGRIGAWNISNPVYHHYFGLRETCSFAQTHMYLDPVFIENKIQDQLDSITQRLIEGNVDVQVIVEGYNLFFERLQDKLANYNFVVFYDRDFPPETAEVSADRVNKTGIIVNLDKYTLSNAVLFSKEYLEPADRMPKRERYLGIPIVFLENFAGDRIAVAGIHVPGSNQRQPIKGLNYVQDVANDLLELNLNGIVMIGDFNSIPKLVQENVKGIRIKLSPYPTHVNPGTQVSYYDMALIDGMPSAKMLQISDMSVYTQAFIQSIQSCRNYYLSKE